MTEEGKQTSERLSRSEARMSHGVYSDVLYEELKQACARHDEYQYGFDRLLENILDTRDDDSEMLAMIDKMTSNMNDIGDVLMQFEKITRPETDEEDV